MMQKITIQLTQEEVTLVAKLSDNSPFPTVSEWFSSLIRHEGQRVAGFNKEIAKLMEACDARDAQEQS